MVNLFNDTVLILKKIFEPISIVYHLFFISFLAWLIFLKPANEHINILFIRVLGSYVVLYGLTIIIFGPIIMNP